MSKIKAYFYEVTSISKNKYQIWLKEHQKFCQNLDSTQPTSVKLGSLQGGIMICHTNPSAQTVKVVKMLSELEVFW